LYRRMSVLAAVLALVAALLFAVANVAQQRAASDVPDESAKGIGLIKRLVRKPLWLAGLGGDTGGYIAQAAALGLGSLLLVQPLLVTALLFALPLGAWWAGRKLRRADWIWAIVLSLALAIFVVAGNPTSGRNRAGLDGWLAPGITVVVVVAICVGIGAISHGTRRAVLLAIATGVLYGVTAALTKSVVELLTHGIWALLTNWETYALAVAATLGTLLQQSAFQAGGLGASMPTVMVLEPMVAAVLGVIVLEERIRANGLGWVLIVAVVIAMVVGTVALAISSAHEQVTPKPEPQPAE
jgi:drug/metabolite transporter (DMT)-like permease